MVVKIDIKINTCYVQHQSWKILIKINNSQIQVQDNISNEKNRFFEDIRRSFSF